MIDAKTSSPSTDLSGRAVLLCCHGSRDPASVRGSQAVARRLARRIAPRPVFCAFLEFAEPTIYETLKQLVGMGFSKIDCIPLMLGAAGHVKNDIAWLVREFSASQPDVKLRMTRDLGLDNLMINLCHRRLKEALDGNNLSAVDDTGLLMVGRGTSDSDANGDIAKLTRIMQEAFGFPVAMTAYSGVAHPRVDAGLKMLDCLSYKNILVAPYLLFPGRLVDRVASICKDFSAKSSKKLVLASHLRGDKEVVDCLIKRLSALDDGGDTNMNCSLCKYRYVIPGHEVGFGQAQVAHHFHNEAGHHH